MSQRTEITTPILCHPLIALPHARAAAAEHKWLDCHRFAMASWRRKRNAPPKRGESRGNGMRIQTRSKLSVQERRPLALGNDGLRIFPNRSLANRILANWSLANRRRRRQRLLARQIGGGGIAQHRQGCGQCSYNLQHV